MQKNIAECVEVNAEDGNVHTYGYMVGNSVGNFPFLYQSKTGGLLTPVYLGDGDKIGCVGEKTVILSNNKVEPIIVPTIDATLKNLRFPTIALNLGMDDYIKVSESSAFREFDKQVKGDEVVVYVPIIGFDEVAIRLYQEAQKGDMLTCFGEIKRMVLNVPNKKIMALWLRDARIIKKAKRNLEAADIGI